MSRHQLRQATLVSLLGAALLTGCQPQATHGLTWPHDLTVTLNYANHHKTCTHERVDIGVKRQPPAFSEALSGETKRSFTLSGVQQGDWISVKAHCQPDTEKVVEAATAFPANELTTDHIVIFHTRRAKGGLEFGRYNDE